MTEPIGNRRLGIFTGLIAVAIISTNPAAAKLASFGAGFYTIVIGLTATSVVGLLVILLLSNINLRTQLSKPGVAYLAIAGVAKGLNDLCYYYALSEGPTLETNVIAYLWPIFGIIAGHFLLKKDWRVYRFSEWMLIATSFFGAIAIVVGSKGTAAMDLSLTQYLAAFLSAVFGVYIVFLIAGAQNLTGTRFQRAFISLLCCQIVAFLTLLLWAPFLPVSVPSSATSAIAILYLGLMVVIAFEALWLLSATLYRNLSFQSIAYFSPLFGAIILSVLALDKLTPISIMGMAAVIIGNTLLHLKRVFNPSIILFVFTVFIVSFFRTTSFQYHATEEYITLLELSFLLFAILTGFIMNRLHERNRSIRERLIELQDRIGSAIPAHTKKRILYRLFNYIFSRTSWEREMVGYRMAVDFRKNSHLISHLRKDIAQIMAAKNEGIFLGENVVVYLLGFLIVVHCMIVELDAVHMEIMASMLAGVVVFTITSLKELDWGTQGTSAVKLATLQYDSFISTDVIWYPRQLDRNLAMPMPVSGDVRVQHTPGGSTMPVRRTNVHRYAIGVLIAITALVSATYISASNCNMEDVGLCESFRAIGLDLTGG